jgi:phage baseplate assembly protein gpV
MKYKILSYKILSGKLKGETIELEEVKDYQKTVIERKELEWSDSSSEPMTWEQAQEWAKSLGNSWRLPTISELQSAFDYEKGEARIDGFVANGYWSSVTVPSSSANAYNVGMNNGYVFSNPKSNNWYVRCVR